ncbi:MAG TPA: hypothetical protein VFX98_09875 [Longimicrobiaceae bacterium]|nr:hypothetical protein [Longimicrobiaceae bacterium]
MRTRSPAQAALIALAALAACERAESREPALSPLEEYNRQLAARWATARPVLREPEAAFSRAFRLLRRATLELPGDPGIALLPTVCGMDGEGTVYLGTRRTSLVHRWSLADGRIERIPFRAADAPRDPTALAWSADENTLYLLDSGGKRLLRYAPDGTLRGYTYLNGGQTGFSLALLPGGSVLAGGERWEDDGAVTLLAVYDRGGRLRRAFLPMDSAVIASNAHAHVPVVFAVEEGGTLLAAEPTSYRIRRLSPEGAELARFGEPPPGYAAPSPRNERATLPETEAWLAGWTPLLFVHAGDGLAFAAYEVRRPYRGFQLDVYTRDGRRLAEGLLSDAQPTCGSGRTLVFTRRTGPGTVELLAYAYEGTERHQEVER